jgi:hypothetical protein
MYLYSSLRASLECNGTTWGEPDSSFLCRLRHSLLRVVDQLRDAYRCTLRELTYIPEMNTEVAVFSHELTWAHLAEWDRRGWDIHNGYGYYERHVQLARS